MTGSSTKADSVDGVFATVSCFQEPTNHFSRIPEAQQFGVPPDLQVPGGRPTRASLGILDVDFGGGSLTTVKVAEDGARLILRLWDVLDRLVSGSVNHLTALPPRRYAHALERPQQKPAIRERRATFTAASRSIGTLGLTLAER